MTSAVPDIEKLSDRITGHRFPGGKISFAPHEVWLGNDAMAGSGGYGRMNPLWFLVASLRGMGLSIDDLVRIADTTMEDGVLFGEMSIEQDVPLVADAEYTVSGGIRSINRREGRSGVFDVMLFELEVFDSDGALQGRVENSFILQRKVA